ncbi:hypothetical protein A6046_00985 [[Haemophilus] ducreyi]|uniref:Hemophilus-specific protein n=2 Tax=Haemophilus ducreyi TaxID=730 RepID=Q7VMN2_HAEDU|nr:hypothetical protein [[Haemophilus] ducreyi]AAP95824.1 hypothetical protein HD_0942 [[Haemophilus] ducreyi 35000HP]AKO30857.1 hypothetical protein RY60_03725 [[Haemophilus] ducreyi]AKO32295.1 hypothetical protein RZ57_03730 [[Haemophilus] ducreyi]AKO33749.1 hypothetical protein RZ58_03745 [[Haemophilus] ducreyi]AKO35197.1 hypothetical protein RZ59_03710 [[Haemophilus] ducreyi]
MDNYNLLDLPDMQIDFNQPVSLSCGLKNQDELMDYFVPYLNDWSEHQYSIHEFAQKYVDKFSLWSANDIVPIMEVAKTEELACFRIYINHPSGEVVFHCRIKTKGLVQ